MVTESASRSISGVEYTRMGEIRGHRMVVQTVSIVDYDELVEIETAAGETRLGRVLERRDFSLSSLRLSQLLLSENHAESKNS